MFGALGLDRHTLLCPDLYELWGSELGSSALDGKRAISLVHRHMLMFPCTFESLNGLSRERLERNLWMWAMDRVGLAGLLVWAEPFL